MQTLTTGGRALVEDIAQRHAVSTDAILTLLQALERGGGTQAQFSHPDLGGMGQWSRGGMIMVGDMFNSALKARVDQLCLDLSDLLRSHDLFVGERPGTSSYGGAWWPEDFGVPSSTGSQNDMRYAFFPETRRLALQQGGVTTTYDTGDHRITGVSQQQSGTQNLTFTSQHGTVRLYDLGQIAEPAAKLPPHQTAPSNQAEPQFADVFAKIERLHELHRKGVLSDTEYSAKKKELLDRL
ncbi:SHOCT domain-containing protein [Beijerinckia sp. L45]|uniref:SHOCT domain-containing protein n=1 Tax=Beijerinckia sp. L45 TaxID=1641855 RepID=UPI00131B55AA|nr:SHOCT domain-containing protein [Beijerinckia sp. L45]